MDKLSAAYDLATNGEFDFGEEDLQERLGIIRGSIFEVLVQQIVKSRHSVFCHNCQVKIYGRVQHLPHKPPKTVDVAGTDRIVDPSRGEVYECKVGPGRIEQTHFLFVEHLKDKLDNNSAGLFLVAILCMDVKYNLQKRIKRLGLDLDYLKYCVTLENLEKLWDYRDIRKYLAG